MSRSWCWPTREMRWKRSLSWNSGADDYVRLPCDLTELTARVWALLRRSGATVAHEAESPLLSGRLLVNPATYEAFLGPERLALTTTEFRLLHLLVKNWGMVVGRQTLERTLWGEQTDSYGLVKRYIQRLRSKLKDDAREPYWIASVHGVGFGSLGRRRRRWKRRIMPRLCNPQRRWKYLLAISLWTLPRAGTCTLLNPIF